MEQTLFLHCCALVCDQNQQSLTYRVEWDYSDALTFQVSHFSHQSIVYHIMKLNYCSIPRGDRSLLDCLLSPVPLVASEASSESSRSCVFELRVPIPCFRLAKATFLVLSLSFFEEKQLETGNKLPRTTAKHKKLGPGSGGRGNRTSALCSRSKNNCFLLVSLALLCLP